MFWSLLECKTPRVSFKPCGSFSLYWVTEGRLWQEAGGETEATSTENFTSLLNWGITPTVTKGSS